MMMSGSDASPSWSWRLGNTAIAAAHAEKWLARIHQEIEEKFFGPNPAAQSR
jgi:hypothetical protein